MAAFTPVPRLRVQILSPLRASAERSVEEHVAFAERLCRVAALAGCAPMAPHVFYPHFLVEEVQGERDIGIECGLAWLSLCHEVWVWDVWGISEGMMTEIAAALRLGVSVKYFSRGEVPTWKGVAVG